MKNEGYDAGKGASRKRSLYEQQGQHDDEQNDDDNDNNQDRFEDSEKKPKSKKGKQEAYSCKSEPGWLRIQDTPKIRYVTNDYFHQKHHKWSFHSYILCRPLYTH